MSPNKPSGTTLALRVRIFFIDIQSHYMHLQVRVGRNLVFPPNGTTGPEWTLVYTSTSTSTPSSTSIGAIVGGSIAASVIITLLIVAIPLLIVIFILKKRSKDKKEK